MKISLAIICKDEIKHIQRIINDYAQYFDEVVIAYDDEIIAKEIKEEGKVRLFKYEWKDDFSAKRNFLASKVTGDYYFRLDADDAIIHPENIAPLADKARLERISIVYCYYLYSKDAWGNCNASHYREAIIRKDKNLYWNKPIHENILPRSTVEYTIYLDDKKSVVYDHLVGEEHIEVSLNRNIRYLIREYNRDKENTDPRTLGYLGKMFAAAKHPKEAIFFLQKHIQSSGWDEDRYFSWNTLAELYIDKKEFDTAISCVFEALQERTDYPDAYLRLMDIYFEQEKWGKAVEWGTMGLSRETPKTFMLIDPSAYGWRPVIKMAYAHFKLGEFKKALEFLKIAKKQVPTLDFILENERHFELASEHQDYVEKFIWIIRYLEGKNAVDKIKRTLDVVPSDIAEHDVVIKLRQKYFPPKKWDDNTVVIFCGHTSEEFSPKSIKTGIGGSEEAVINLSLELTKLGYRVTVYNNCGDNEGEYDGVTYLNWVKFNIKDEFDNFIAWRFNMFDVGVLAKNKVVWLHDVPQEEQLAGEKSKFFDKVVVLSEYHKSLLPKDVPQEKIFVSTNGIVPEQFKGLEDIKREPHRIIYASSYNRGLEQLLEMWPDIRKEVPDATLHIMYGWTVYDKFVNEGFVKDDGFKKKMVKLMMQDGVYEYGRIGHKELLKEYAKSSVFAYPCNYVGEINCIALTKAQACGCYCATNDFAVLGERNSAAVSNDKFKDKLIEFLKLENKLDNIQDRFIQENSWKSVAWGWIQRILKPDVPTINRFYQDFIRDSVTIGETIVDIGCAEGHTFRDWEGVDKVTHVDLDDHGYLNNFVRADANKLPLKDKQFDVGVLGELLEHVPDPITVLKEAKRVAKKLVITVPNENEWTAWQLPFHKVEDKERVTGKTRVQLLEKEGKIPIEKYFKDDNYEHLWHHRFYTPKTLAEDLEKAGITDYKLYKVRFMYWCHYGVTANV